MTSNPVPVAQIYAAFDNRTETIFRAAIARSSAGIVRRTDLLASLVSLAGEVAGDLCPSLWRKMAEIPSPGDPELTPLANEPALRELLQTAYRLASIQPRPSRTITPKILWAAALLGDPSMAQKTTDTILNRWELAGTNRQVAPNLDRTHRPPYAREIRRPPIPRVAQVGAHLDVDRLMDEILEDWLAMQSLASDLDRSYLHADLAVRTARLEQLA